MRCIDGLCGDDACWYCGRKRVPMEDADDLYDGDTMQGDRYAGLIEPSAGGEGWADSARNSPAHSSVSDSTKGGDK